MKTAILQPVALLLAALGAACGSAAPVAITPTLPGDGDSHVASDAPRSKAAAAADPWAGRTDLLKAPAPQPPTPVALPPFVRFSLPSGLQVVALKIDRLPVVSMQLAVKAGRIDEPAVKVGIAELTANMLVKGTRTRKAFDLTRAVDRIGGNLTADASYEATVVGCNALARELATCLSLVPEMVSAPTFPADQIVSAREGVLADIRRRFEDPGQTASTHVQNLLWGDEHPRGWAATADGVAALTRDDIVAWHKAHFSPDNAVLVVVGAIDPARLKADLGRAFAGWKRSKTAPRPTLVEPRLSGIKVRLVDAPRQQVTQIRVGQLGIRHDDPRFFESLVWNFSLGGSPAGSRLSRALRVDAGELSASSVFDRNVDRGSFVATATATTPRAVSTAEKVIAEISRMNREGPSEAEVAEAVANIAGSYRLRFESAADIAASVLAAELHGFGEEYIANYAVRVGKVDQASAHQAAHEILDPANFVIVLLGPAKELEPQLKAKGWRYQKVAYASAIGGPVALPPDPKAEQAGRALLAQAMVAKGGEAKLAQVKTLTLTARGNLTAQGKVVNVEVTRRVARPDKMRVDLLLSEGKVKISYAFDSKGGWQSTPDGIADIPADQLPSLLRQRWLDPELILLRGKDKDVVVRALPDETIDGTPCKLVNLTSADGKQTATLYFDAKTNLLFRMAYPEQGGVTVDAFADYRPEAGLQVAHKRESRNLVDGKLGNEAATLELVSVAINPSFDASVFARPAAGAGK